MNETVIAVDPGREKCGIAVVDRKDGVLWKGVIQTPRLAEVVAGLAAERQVITAVVGDRTASRAARGVLSGIRVDGKPLTIVPVDEHRSSDEARGRYWLDHPPKGLRRLIPVTMRVPPAPVDDYVAVILAERYFSRLG